MKTKPSACLRYRDRTQIAHLRRRYKVTQEQVARLAGVDRSMVAKVWAGVVTSAPVVVATHELFRACGWAPARPPEWYTRAAAIQAARGPVSRAS